MVGGRHRDSVRRGFAYGPALGWAAAIFWASHQSTTPRLGASDKLLHLLVYFVFALLWVRAFSMTTRWRPSVIFVVSAALGVAYGVFDEVHQSFVPGRHATLDDVIADAAGAIAGAALVFVRRASLR